MTLARRAWAEVFYQGKDISNDLKPYLLQVTYTDNSGGKADEISIQLQDREGLWRGSWLPSTGDKLEVRIHADEWGEGGGSLFAGTFTVDKLSLAGPPSTVTISGTSLPTGLAARKTKRNRAWEQATLQTIAGDVAASARMPLVWDAPEGLVLDRADQRGETDLAFLQRLCEANYFCVKVHDDQIVVWDPVAYGAKEPITTYTLGESRVISWSMDVKAYISTPKVEVKYQDPCTGTVQQSTAVAPEDPNDPLNLNKPVEVPMTGVLGEMGLTEEAPAVNPQSFDEDAAEVVIQRARSKAEAEALAQARLHATQAHKAEGSISVVGDTRLVAGNTVRLAGWQQLDGKYLVDQAVHAIGKGYTVQAKLKRA